VSRHVSAETLGRHREGTLSARKAASIDAHLSGCARCAGTNTGLAAVSNLLASTQLPPMPDSLAQGIQMAIASESAERATRNAAPGAGARAAGAAELADAPEASRAAVPGADAETTHIPGRPDLPPRTGRRRRVASRLRMPRLSSPLVLRGLAAAAAVVVVAGAGFLLANGPTATENTAGSGAQSAGAPAASRPLSNGGQASLSHRVSLRYRLNGKIVATTALSSSTNFRRNSIARQVRKDVSSAPGIEPTVAPQPAANSVKATIFRVSLAQLEGCLSRVDAGRRVLVVNIARFLGKRATIVVLRSLKSADLLDVAIVGPSCSASHADVIYRTTIPAG